MVQSRSFFSGRMPIRPSSRSPSERTVLIRKVTALRTQRINAPRTGIISSSSITNAIAERTHPKMDSSVPNTALTAVVTMSHRTQKNVVIQVQATQTTLETQVQATQTMFEIHVHASQAHEHGHQSQQSR